MPSFGDMIQFAGEEKKRNQNRVAVRATNVALQKNAGDVEINNVKLAFYPASSLLGLSFFGVGHIFSFPKKKEKQNYRYQVSPLARVAVLVSVAPVGVSCKAVKQVLTVLQALFRPPFQRQTMSKGASEWRGCRAGDTTMHEAMHISVAGA
jgi:hypothetical protein